MGDIADMILDGILDEETGEYIDDEISEKGGCGYPRRWTKSSKYPYSRKNVKAIRKKLALLIKKKKINCNSQKEINKAVNDARKEINKIYGKGWGEACF
jgi:hypothetical protein